MKEPKSPFLSVGEEKSIMYKYILFIAMMLLSAVPTLSDTNIGLYAGNNSANLSGDSPSRWRYMSKNGLTGGLLLEQKIATDVWLCASPGFSVKGTKIGVDIPGERDPKDSLSVNINYVSLPLLVKIVTKYPNVFVSAGFDFSWRQNAFYKQIENSGDKVDISDGFDDVNISALFGVGFLFSVGRPLLQIELRYMQGLLNISTFEAMNPEEQLPPQFKTKGMQVSVGLVYPLSRRND